MSDRLFNKVSKKKNINKKYKQKIICNNKMLTKTSICNKGLVMLQWNAKGLRSMGHGEELKKFVTDLNNKIIYCLYSRPWINNITP